jgi:uncharacterized cysteine cluster protein YcgN (CxxCxxCC family)
MWQKVMLTELETSEPEAFVVVGECRRCRRCCGCLYYDLPDQRDEIPPRKGWCPQLDLESKVCRVWEERPEGCRNFPTVRDFELGAVPPDCGFKLVREEVA